MIPVENAQIQRIDTQIRKHNNMDTRKKKELLIKELQWCNSRMFCVILFYMILFPSFFPLSGFVMPCGKI